MSIPHWLAAAALIGAFPLAATAQQAQQPLNPVDADAPVSSASYVSAFKNYRASSEDEATPDKVWRRANDEMQSLGGHAGHMKEAGAVAATETSTANAKGPQAPVQNAPKANPHAGHAGH